MNLEKREKLHTCIDYSKTYKRFSDKKRIDALSKADAICNSVTTIFDVYLFTYACCAGLSVRACDQIKQSTKHDMHV